MHSPDNSESDSWATDQGRTVVPSSGASRSSPCSYTFSGPRRPSSPDPSGPRGAAPRGHLYDRETLLEPRGAPFGLPIDRAGCSESNVLRRHQDLGIPHAPTHGTRASPLLPTASYSVCRVPHWPLTSCARRPVWSWEAHSVRDNRARNSHQRRPPPGGRPRPGLGGNPLFAGIGDNAGPRATARSGGALRELYAAHGSWPSALIVSCVSVHGGVIPGTWRTSPPGLAFGWTEKSSVSRTGSVGAIPPESALQ